MICGCVKTGARSADVTWSWGNPAVDPGGGDKLGSRIELGVCGMRGGAWVLRERRYGGDAYGLLASGQPKKERRALRSESR